MKRMKVRLWFNPHTNSEIIVKYGGYSRSIFGRIPGVLYAPYNLLWGEASDNIRVMNYLSFLTEGGEVE